METINYTGRTNSRNKPKIRMLTSCFGWDKGDEFVIQMEDDEYLYFDDVNDRWTALEKEYENIDFIYLRRGKK